MKYLFIGGSLDGNKVALPETTTTHRHRPEIKLLNVLHHDIPLIEEVYYKHSFRYGEVNFELYLHTSIKPDTIIKLLTIPHG